MTIVMWIRVLPYKSTCFENRKSILHFIAFVVLHTDSCTYFMPLPVISYWRHSVFGLCVSPWSCIKSLWIQYQTVYGNCTNSQFRCYWGHRWTGLVELSWVESEYLYSAPNSLISHNGAGQWITGAGKAESSAGAWRCSATVQVRFLRSKGQRSWPGQDQIWSKKRAGNFDGHVFKHYGQKSTCTVKAYRLTVCRQGPPGSLIHWFVGENIFTAAGDDAINNDS